MKSMKQNKVILITGLSGAGRTSALKILEDIGYEAIDNLPTSLIVNILDLNIKKKIAVGIDVRSRGFNAKKIAELVLERKKKTNDISIVFLIVIILIL